MTKKEDTKKATELHVTDVRTSEVTKVVYLQDIQIGPSSDPKSLDVTENVIVRQNVFITGSLFSAQNVFVSGSIFARGLSGSIQRIESGLSYISGQGPIIVSSSSNGQIFVNTQDEASPNAMSGLVGWYESTLAAVVLDSSSNPLSVQRWIDLSGNGRHLGQGTKARQPIWFLSNPELSGSQSSLEFQAGQVLTSSNISLGTFTIIIALQNKSNATLIFEHSANATSNDGAWLFGSRTAALGNTMLVRRSSTNCARDMASATWATHSDQPSVYTMMHGGTSGSLRLYIDNVDMRELTTPTANNLGSTTTNTTLNVGARSTLTSPMSGSMMGLAVYTPALTPFQAAKVVRYFGRKFGIHVV